MATPPGRGQLVGAAFSFVRRRDIYCAELRGCEVADSAEPKVPPNMGGRKLLDSPPPVVTHDHSHAS